jgi:NADH dehydrogenase/NADH:ubiquinone oxidoreductase subunit G
LKRCFQLKQWAKTWFQRVSMTTSFLSERINLFQILNVKSKIIHPEKRDYEKYTYVMYVGVNLRYEAPLVNLFIRQQTRKREITVLGFMNNLNLTYDYVNCGANLTHVLNLIKG